MTKLLTSIAAMQVVESGLLKLDDDIASFVPELAKQPVLEGFHEDGRAILRARLSPITFRQLLTHSAGLSYYFMDSDMAECVAKVDWDGADSPTVRQRYAYPLRYQPGTSWRYSPGVDWAGQAVERVTGISLEEYMESKIFKPLGITGITFFPSKHPALEARRTGMTERDQSSGALLNYTGPSINDANEEAFGGQGAYADLTDYAKVLESLLLNDEKLLSKSSVDEMFRPQLAGKSKDALVNVMATPELRKAFVGDFPEGVEYNWGIGGILTCSDESGARGRKSGTLIWSGLPNMFWVSQSEVDRNRIMLTSTSFSTVKRAYTVSLAHTWCQPPTRWCVG